MKKIYSIITVLSIMLLGLSYGASGQTPTYAYNIDNTTNAFPLSSTTSNRVQNLYVPSNFPGIISGNITTVYIRSANAMSPTTFTNLTISMGNTSATSLTTGAWVPGLTPVYSAPTTTTGTIAANGWFMVTLQSPFPYSNSQNLIVDISQSGYTLSGLSVRYESANAGTRAWGPVTGAASTGSGAGALNIGFDILPSGPCTSPPTPGTTFASATNLCSGSALTLNLNGNSYGALQSYQWQTGPTATGPWTNIGTPSVISPYFSTTVSATAYYRAAVTCGASTAYSNAVQVTVPGLFPGGTYTINGTLPASGTNFQTFGAAVSAISCGTTGPVIFNVDSATYGEQVDIPQINTNSATNTITFNGNGATLIYSGTAAAPHTLMLSGADYIRVNNLHIEGADLTYALACHLYNGANNNIFTNCTFAAQANTTGTLSVPFSISGVPTSATTGGLAGDSNLVTGCTMFSGYYNTTIVGALATMATGNKITDCHMTDFYFYGCYNVYSNGTVWSGNEIERPTRTTLSTFYGFYISSGCQSITIEKNSLHDPFGTTPSSASAVYAIYGLSSPTLGNEHNIINNKIYNLQSNGTQYMIYLSAYNYYNVYHNTLVSDYASTGGLVYGIYSTGTVGLNIKNNIVHITRDGSGVKYGLYYSGAKNSDYNDIYVNSPGSGTQAVGYFGGAQTTLAAFQGASNTDANSVSMDPVYTSASTGNLKPTATSFDNLGTGTVGVLTDILNVSRNATTPDIGAYEFGCSAVPNIVVSNLTSNSATVTWGTPTPSTGFEYVFDQIPTSPIVAGTPTLLNTYNAAGLTQFTTYYFHIRNKCSATNYSGWANIPITTLCVPPPATVTAAGATTFCAGGSVTLTANAGTGYTYVWNLNGVPITPSATGISYVATTSGSYTVKVTTPTPCSATSTATVVTANPLPSTVITTSGTTTFCVGGSVTLTAPAAPAGSTYTYVWKNNGTPISPAQTGQTLLVTTTSNITVTITNTVTTCSATTATPLVITVAAPSAPITATGPTTFCAGDSVSFRTNKAGGLSYQWYQGSIAPGNSIGGAVDSTFKTYTAGTYFVQVSVTGLSGCFTNSTGIPVTVNPLPFSAITASGAPTTFCQGGNVVLTATPSTGVSYQWRIGGTNAAAPSTSQTFTAATAGTYTAFITTTATGCAALSNSIPVAVNALPAATVTPATIAVCAGNSTTLSANTGMGLTYQWYNGTSLIAGATTSTYAANTAGTYTVRVTNANNCTSTSGNSVVSITPPPVLNVTPTGATTLCGSDTLTIVGPTGTGYAYQWKLGAANATGVSTNRDYKATTAGSYTVVVTANGCPATSAATVVTLGTKPTVAKTPTAATTACDSVVLNSTSTNVTYQWIYNGNDIAGATANRYAATASGSYSLKVTGTNGCTATTPAATIVNVNQAPAAVITHATPLSFCAGGAVTLNTNAAANKTYSWSLNGAAIGGATTPNYITSQSGAYRVRIVDTVTGCSRTSEFVQVINNPLPEPFVTYNQATNTLSTTPNFVTYQWYRNTQPLGGATTRSFTPLTNGAYAVTVTDTNGCVNISSFKFVNSLAVGTVVSGKEISVFPNPTTGIVTIKSPVEMDVVLQDATGKVVPIKMINNQIDVTPLADGMYMMRLLSKSGVLLKMDKIVKISNR